MRVLVVDDDADVRLIVAVNLRLAGMEVDEATSGQEAVQWLDRRAYDLVILDQRMPGMTGLEIAEIVRERLPSLPLALFSAYLRPTVEDRARELGIRLVPKTELEQLPAIARQIVAAAGEEA